MKTKHFSKARLLKLGGALFLITSLVHAQLRPPLPGDPQLWDNCVQIALQGQVNWVVPFKMVSSSSGAGPVAYAGSGTLDNLRIGSFGFNYLAGYVNELFDNRLASIVSPCQPGIQCLGTTQPFDVTSSDSIYLQI
jgi:hypothetical protein